jgi:hypothetical protein
MQNNILYQERKKISDANGQVVAISSNFNLVMPGREYLLLYSIVITSSKPNDG